MECVVAYDNTFVANDGTRALSETDLGNAAATLTTEPAWCAEVEGGEVRIRFSTNMPARLGEGPLLFDLESKSDPLSRVEIEEARPRSTMPDERAATLRVVSIIKDPAPSIPRAVRYIAIVYQVYAWRMVQHALLLLVQIQNAPDADARIPV